MLLYEVRNQVAFDTSKLVYGLICMNNQFQNYSKTKSFDLQVEAGFAIVPTDKKVGLAESIFWNNFVSVCAVAVIPNLAMAGAKDQRRQVARDA